MANNYEEVLKFAQEIDPRKYGKDKDLIVCYKNMLIQHIEEIFKMDMRRANFEKSIEGHLRELAKFDIKMTFKEPENEQLPKGTEKSAKGKEVLREPGLSSGSSTVQQVAKE